MDYILPAILHLIKKEKNINWNNIFCRHGLWLPLLVFEKSILKIKQHFTRQFKISVIKSVNMENDLYKRNRKFKYGQWGTADNIKKQWINNKKGNGTEKKESTPKRIKISKIQKLFFLILSFKQCSLFSEAPLPILDCGWFVADATIRKILKLSVSHAMVVALIASRMNVLIVTLWSGFLTFFSLYLCHPTLKNTSIVTTVHKIIEAQVIEG